MPDIHADPNFNNDRADLLAKLTIDLRPDVVINLGDSADMSSLSSYDKGTRSFQGRSYKKDIDAHLDFQERWWLPVKRMKKKLPYRVVLEGNHERRVERALDLSPELAGTIDFKDFDYDTYYDTIVRYDGGTPGIIELDNILFAHYFITGVSGRPVSGERPASMMMAKNNCSSIAGHQHTFDYVTRTNINGETINCLIAGCFHSHIPQWAGNIGKLWRPGVAILRNVENGDFDLQWVSLKALEKEYS